MRNTRVEKLLAVFGPQTIACLMGAISLVWVLAPIRLVWLPGPSDVMLRRSLFPISFLLTTALNSLAARFGLLARRGPAVWLDAASYIVLFAVLRPIRSISGSQGLPVGLSVLFLGLVFAKSGALFVAIHRALHRGPTTIEPSRSPAAPPGSRLSGRILTCMFLTGFSFCFLLGLHAAAKMCTQPDEPFYLLIAQSIIHDGDLDLNNNLEAREYAPYYPGTLLPQRDVNEKGEYISRHGVLFAALLVPFYGSFGRVGTMAFSCLAYAAFSVFLFSVCERETGSRKAAFWTWTIALVATPGLTYSTQIYPESLACLLIMLLLTAALQRRRPPTGWLAACGLAAAVILPWLKARYALVGLPLLVLWLLGIMRTREKPAGARAGFGRRGIAAAVLSGTLGSLVLALLFHRTVAFRLFGAMNLGDILHLQWSRCWYNLFALFLDFQYGLLVYSPVFLFALWGFLVILRRNNCVGITTAVTQRPIDETPGRRPRLVWITACSTAVYLLALSTLGWWFGGGCPPGRYLVCLLPILLLNVSFGLTSSRGLLARSLLALFCTYTALMSFLMALFPIDRYMVPGSHNLALARLLLTARLPLDLVPSFIRANAASYVSIAISVAGISALFALVKRSH